MTSLFASFERDESNTYIITLTGSPSLTTYNEQFLDKLSEILNHRVKVTFLIDASAVFGINVLMAHSTVRWMRVHRELVHTYLRGTVVVTQNQMVHKMIQFVLKLQTPAAPFQTVRTLEEAHEYVNTVLNVDA
jgi:hypothetical protein